MALLPGAVASAQIGVSAGEFDTHQAPASVPAGADLPQPLPASAAPVPASLPAKVRREAENSYLHGAKALDGNDLPTAEQDFLRATQLNPENRDYALALVVTREHRVTALIQQAAQATRTGDPAQAEKLLHEAQALDPQNAVVRQHFDPGGALSLSVNDAMAFDPYREQRNRQVDSLGGAILLVPDPGSHALHLRGDARQLLTGVCNAWGLRAGFDANFSAAASGGSGQPLRLDLEGATFDQALRAAELLTHTFAIAQQPKVAFFAPDTPDKRNQFTPLFEETLLVPGVTPEVLTEYANLARNVFNLKTVNAVSSSGSLVLRGDAQTLQSANSTLAGLVDGGAEVLLDLSLYEIDRSKTIDLGASTPSSVGVFPVAAEAQSLISANQTLISQAVANNLITLTGNPYTDALTELEFLVATGTVNSSEFTNLLGVLGHYGGLPLAGIYLGQGSTFNALLNESDIRMLDTVQLRAAGGQEADFRAGTRYPIETGIYSSNLSSQLTSAVAGLTINGTSVASLLGGASSVSVPQIQYEDLGLTLKATPEVQRTGDVHLKLDFKVEALGTGALNTLPVLNNRQLTSQVTVPAGQTALLASLVSTSEMRSIDGLPFLSELPGFQGTEKTSDVATTELVIMLTPHVVRARRLEIASQRLLIPAAIRGQQ